MRHQRGVKLFHLILISFLVQISVAHSETCEAPLSVCATDQGSGFPLITDGTPVPLLISVKDLKPVLRASEDLVADLERVGGQPMARMSSGEEAEFAVIVGSLQSPLIRQLLDSGKLDTAEIEGKWEAYLQTVIDDPLPGIDRALVIAGSDARGTVYGIYDLLERSGVSPWEWWADVPIRQQTFLYVTPGRKTDAPVVKYRGIFLNDENPALYGWVNETYGGFNADFYERVFQLILRQKGNYLWPAMWGKAFYDDDPMNQVTAEEYGIVIGTSHHEPLLRAHVEWERHGEGAWDYTKNAEKLRDFWRGGMKRMGGEETIVTVGMRGDGDEAMTEGTAIDLLETIVRDQRKIIADVTGKPASEQPQIWALYKEVQDYYDKGMEVPDDVTLLFADDNWGQIRRLPDPAAKRPGGYGVYYHFDYVGGPRNYKWINVTQNERVWEQMHLAWKHDATRIWIVNVGDLKPMEFPINFFLDYAWDPADIPLEGLDTYSTLWAEQQFGGSHAEEIARLLDLYTKYNSRRTPELLNAETYSLTHFDEWARVAADYQQLAAKADTIRRELPPEYEDAFLQLVWYPVQASANLYELYYRVALNHLYADQGRSQTNDMATRARALYARDAELTRIYHEEIAGGKWNHMMSQTHIGYTYWQQPDEQVMPEVREVNLPRRGALGVSIEGDERAWPGLEGEPSLPVMDNIHQQTRRIELFNKGQQPVRFSAEADQPWLELSQSRGRIREATALTISIDWEAVPAGRHEGRVTVNGADGEAATIRVPVINTSDMTLSGALPDGGIVSIDASTPACHIAKTPFSWETITNLGRESSAIMPMPVTAEPQKAGDGPELIYPFTVYEAGTYQAEIFLSPALDVTGGDGLDFALSVNDETPIPVNMHMVPDDPVWNRAVSDNALRKIVEFEIDAAGPQALHLWMVDPGVVFQKIVISKGPAPDSYLGAPFSKVAASETSCTR
ncbi:glycosyl hydrolase 115 family protein [Parvularcula marina]|uniref:Glycosyl hydrolase n=1 Tax=Parvularcula marina TaxID=2292771 RepID=A0A371RFS7_9PROT|nr:glycosyl hydrolase 115 family protein [Parvularcula marina]RFB04304.1 glycosyl hydrolase [Parvularcula marina]